MFSDVGLWSETVIHAGLVIPRTPYPFMASWFLCLSPPHPSDSTPRAEAPDLEAAGTPRGLSSVTTVSPWTRSANRTLSTGCWRRGGRGTSESLCRPLRPVPPSAFPSQARDPTWPCTAPGGAFHLDDDRELDSMATPIRAAVLSGGRTRATFPDLHLGDGGGEDGRAHRRFPEGWG